MTQDEKKEVLYRALLSLETLSDCENFLEDLCTMKEINDFSDRMEVAILLNQGLTYEQIIEKTKMSSTTIARINKALHYGKGGYRSVLNKNSTD